MTKKTMALAGAASVLTTTPAAIALAADPVGTPAAGPDTIRAELADHPTVRAQMRSLQHDRLLRRYRRLAKAAGEHRNEARFWSNGRLLKEIGHLRDELRSRQVSTTTAGAETPQLASIAACESGGDPHAIGGGGAFRGKYQFTYRSWAAVGGHGDPADAPEAEQDRRAAMLMARSGTGNWPVCG